MDVNCSEHTFIVVPFSRSANCSPIQAMTESPAESAAAVFLPTTSLVSPGNPKPILRSECPVNVQTIPESTNSAPLISPV
jgi:hypothetical protein